MKVLVFGNVGAGKTTLLNQMGEVVPWPRIAIDDFRRTHGDGSAEGETRARRAFITAIEAGRNQFVECLGVGAAADELWERLRGSDDEMICLVLTTNSSVCRRCVSGREWSIPFPAPLTSVEALIARTEVRIARGDIQARWGTRPNTVLMAAASESASDLEEVRNLLVETLRRAGARDQTAIQAVEMMLGDRAQEYYSKQYSSYQSGVLEESGAYDADRAMIATTLSATKSRGTVVDLGAGSCQWFACFGDDVQRYYAIEVNEAALALAPIDRRLIKLKSNVFESTSGLNRLVAEDNVSVLMSFFLSHFDDGTIEALLRRLAGATEMLIVDTLCRSGDHPKFPTPELRRVRRKTSANSSILLPKRCFDQTHMDSLARRAGLKLDRFDAGTHWFVCRLVPS